MRVLVLLAVVVFVVNSQCPVLSPTPIPDNVNDLDVTNIRALAAMGDSISTGFGINNGVGQIREEVFSIGGVGTTLATVMKSQNPNITGVSLGNNAGFNVAVSGAVVRNMPAQASNLVDRLRTSPEIDYVNDWKMVTIWIGGNNVCAFCNGNVEHTPGFYGTALTDALQILYDNVPRIVVNLITQFNISSMYDATANVPACFVNRIACSCVMTGNADQRRQVDELCQSYNAEMRIVTDKFNNLPRADFGVILQTMAIDSIIPDRSVLSTLDCFHPNRFAHQIIGINGYKDLFKRPADKETRIDFENDEIVCATEQEKKIFMG